MPLLWKGHWLCGLNLCFLKVTSLPFWLSFQHHFDLFAFLSVFEMFFPSLFACLWANFCCFFCLFSVLKKVYNLYNFVLDIFSYNILFSLKRGVSFKVTLISLNKCSKDHFISSGSFVFLIGLCIKQILNVNDHLSIYKAHSWQIGNWESKPGGNGIHTLNSRSNGGKHLGGFASRT